MKPLWEIQTDASKDFFQNKDVNRKQIYYRVISLYVDLLRVYTAKYPAAEQDEQRKKFDRVYSYEVWYHGLELLLKALTNDGVMWDDKLIYKGGENQIYRYVATKADMLVAITSVFMEGGLRTSSLIIRSINHHLWLKEKLSLENINLNEQ